MLQTLARKYGLHFSRPGNGISHYIHMERFGKPGDTIVGADSHTTQAGCLGMIGIGAGGLDVAVVLELLRRLTTSGGKNKIFEFTGPGTEDLSIPERATIANMIADLGGTAGVFPPDANTRDWLERQDRADDFLDIAPDEGAEYGHRVEIDLDELGPLVAKPHNPDNVVPVEEVAGTEVAQLCIGSSVNSGYNDLALPAAVLAAELRPYVEDVHIFAPADEEEAERIEIPRGPNIKRPPEHEPIAETLEVRVATVQPDDISTGDLAPDGVEVMAYRLNVPAIAEFTLPHRDPDFRKRLKEWGNGLIVAGNNYGQGSSREHAALAPLHLGVKAVVAKSFARIHRRNLVAQGILALTFADESDYDKAEVGQTWEFPKIKEELRDGQTVTARIKESGEELSLAHDFSAGEREILICGASQNAGPGRWAARAAAPCRGRTRM